MTPSALKRRAGREPVQARVVSDGCRDYVIEVVSEHGAGLLKRRGGRPMRFRTLAEVHELLGRCGVSHAVLRQRVAHDEACLADGGSPFSELPLKIAS